jgi:tetratricopeptide (TPR) repeat protein
MKRIALSVVILAAVVAGGCGLLHAKREKSAEPFYRKYLVAGNTLDDRIREQEQRVEEQPESADLRNDFANLLAERRFVEDAQRQYETALELDSSHFLAAYNLGLLWEAAGKPNRAISAYRKSISRKPGFPASHFHLGRLYEQRGWDGLAVKEYAKALRIDPKMRDPRVNPLIVDTRLLDRVSLENYPRDIAAAAMAGDRAWADEARFREVPVDRPLSSSEIEDAPAPEPVDATVTAPPTRSSPPARIPARPGQTRPQSGLPPGTPPLLPAGAPPPPTPVPTPGR